MTMANTTNHIMKPTNKEYTFVTKCGIILLLCTISFMVFSKTITIYNPDGTITVCELNEQTGTMYCW
jgi:hypothetical protein